MADINELYGLLQQADTAAQSGNTQAIADVQAILGEIDRANAQQSQGATVPMEQPGMLAAPISGGNGVLPTYRSLPESDKVALDSNQLTKEFLADYKIVTGEPVPVDAKTPRQALDAAVAKGTLTPDFVPGQDFGAFSSQWSPYLMENQSSLGGAFLRGAKQAAGPTAGGYIGAGVGQVVGIPVGGAIGGMVGGPPGMALGAKVGSAAGALIGGFGGSVIGDWIQSSALDAAGLRTNEELAQDAMDQDRAATRWARMAGEIVPQLATSKFAIEPIKQAVAGDVGARIGLGIGAGIGAGSSIGIQAITDQPIDFERATMAALEGLILQPRSNTYFDRMARTEIGALNARNATVRDPMITQDIPKAVTKLQAGRELNQNGVQLGSGSISGNEGLISLENAIFNQDAELRNVRQRSMEAISSNVSGDLQQTGFGPVASQEFFQRKTDELMSTAQQAYQQALAAGQAEQAAILRDATQAASQAQRMANDGLLSADTAHSISLRNFSNAQKTISQMMGVREVPSKTVLDVLQQNANVSKSAAQDLATFNGKGIVSDLANFKAGLEESKSKFSKSLAIPAESQDIINRYTPKRDPKTKSLIQPVIELSDMVADSSLLADNIRKANKSGDTVLVKYLSAIKEGIEKDIDSAGGDSEQLKAFKTAYREHARKFLNETSNDVLVTGKADPAKIIDKYMQSTGKVKGTAGATQLRDALEDNPLGLKAVEDWFVGQMAQAGGVDPKPTQLKNWLESPDTQERLRIFPEAEPRLRSLINQLETEESALAARTATLKAAEANAKKPDSTAAARLTVEANEAMAAAQTKAQQALKIEEDLINNHVATRFIGQKPINAIASIFSETATDPATSMKALLDMAAKDPSGRALQGVKNAVREYIDESIRLAGSVVSTENVPGNLSTKDLEASLRALNDATLLGGTKRELLSMVFGSNSKELQALDLAQQQSAIMARKGRATKGMSSTEPQRAMTEALAEQTGFNTLGFLSRIARGYNVEKAVKPGVTARFFDTLQRVWAGDIKTRTIQVIKDALVDPDKMVAALTDLTPRDMPKVRTWLKQYGIPYAYAPDTTDRETLGNGGVVTDKESGFRMVTRDSKKFRVYYPTGKLLGIYDTEDAAQKATDNELIKIRKFSK